MPASSSQRRASFVPAPSSFLLLLVSLLLPLGVAAQAPVIGEDECLYLTGAPAGAPAAETEETASGFEILEECAADAHFDLNRDRPNQVQGWMSLIPVPTSRHCVGSGWVGHRFTCGGARPALATIRASGAWQGLLEGGISNIDRPTNARIDVRLSALGDSGELVARERPILSSSEHFGRLVLDSTWGVELQHVLLPGQSDELSVRLELEVWAGFDDLDFGRPGAGRQGVTYDAIEACTSDGPGAGSGSDLALEKALNDGQCLAGIWLPEALGGRLEEARDLVATRVTAAQASGARGVNGRVATMQLLVADAATADGDYQRACRSLSHAVRALTTP
jgi:hypothetical protein